MLLLLPDASNVVQISAHLLEHGVASGMGVSRPDSLHRTVNCFLQQLLLLLPLLCDACRSLNIF